MSNGSFPNLKNKESGEFTPCVEPLGTPGESFQIACTAVSASYTLTATCTRVSLHARGDAIRFKFNQGPSAPVANATSHYIAAGERLDFSVPEGSRLAAIRVTADCTLEVTELT